MKRFKFSLQAVRTLRERAEQTALERYARAVAARQQAIEHLRAIRTRCESVWHVRQIMTANGAAAEELSRAQEYSQALEQSVAQGEAQLLNTQRAVDQAWQHLVGARKQREVVDKCHDRQRGRYDHECRTEEQKELDEMATLGSASRRSRMFDTGDDAATVATTQTQGSFS